MKNKFFILFKTIFINTFKLKKASKKTIVLFSFLFIYVAFSLFVSLSLFFNNIYETFYAIGLGNMFLTIIFSLASFSSIAFTIFSSKNALFDNKDNDLLFSLPINRNIVFLTRISQLLFYNFVIGMFVIIPGIYVFFSNNVLSVNNFIVIFLLTIFSSFIPTILSCFFGYFIAWLISKFKNKNLIEMINYCLFLGLYFLFIFKGDVIFELFADNPKLLSNILKYLFFPIYLINLSLSDFNFLYILGFIALNLIVLYLFVTLFSKNYYKIINGLSVSNLKSKFDVNKIEYKSKMQTLIKKEVKRYFSSPIYVFNTVFGVVILLVFSISSFFLSSDELASFITSGIDVSLDKFTLVFIGMLITVGLSCTTNSSISIERSNFWILKMLPVNTKDVFFAKKFVNLLLLIPAVLISSIVFCVSGYVTLLEMFIIMIIGILFSLIVSNFGLICNLAFPKLDAQNDNVIVKQSMASFLGIMVPLLFVIIYVILIYSFEKYMIILITLLLFFVLVFITNLVLNVWGTKRYSRIS